MPFPFQTDSERDYYAWLGLYTSAFSGLEANAFQLLKLFAAKGWTKPIPESRPLSLEAKLKRLREAALLPDLGREREELEAIVAALSDEASFRHDLIHGVNMQFLRTNPKVTVMFRPEIASEVEPKPTSREDLEEHYHLVCKMGMGLIAVRARLFD